MNRLVNTTYSKDDVTILLKDLSGCMEAMDTLEREKMIQSGVHYSEMLPLEYKPTTKYMEIYEKSLDTMSRQTALGIAVMSHVLMNKHNGKFVIISLARAGIPVGILVKRYIKAKYNVDIPHYSISIVRGKGIDVNAMNYIREECAAEYGVEHFQFLDGWTGKGAISRQVTEAVDDLKKNWTGWDNLSDDLAVLADPANICTTCGTHEDFLIPSACLNGTVSGLVSRTILRNDLIDVEAGDFHGAVYFGDLKSEDKSIEFIDTVTGYFDTLDSEEIEKLAAEAGHITGKTGMEVVTEIANEYDIADVNKIKPGVGETTRVLLRRVPWAVLVDSSSKNYEGIDHIKRLCEEKNIPVYERSLGNYRACGLIKDLSADA